MTWKTLHPRIMMLALLAGLVLSLAPASSWADDEFDGGGAEEGGDAGSGEEDVQYEKETTLDFEDFTLEGEVRKPTQATVMERTALDFGNLIEERKNFEPEMILSVDQLQ